MKVKKKAVIYPYGNESAPLARHKELFEDYEINSLIAPKGWGIVGKDAGKADKGEDIGIIVGGDIEYELDKVDILIIPEFNSTDSFRSKVVNVAKLALDKGMEVVCVMHLTEEELFSIEKKNINEGQFKYVHKFKEFSLEPLKTLLDINVPIVFIAGVTENTSKFETQLTIREELISMGYKVGQIGSKDYCQLLGFHSFPDFMINPHVNEVDKILMFNRYVKAIELDENPDLIIIGIPGGLMPFNKVLVNNFGILAYLVSQAVSPDFSIVNVLYDNILSKYFAMLKTSFKYKYGFEVDCFNMSTAQFDYITSKEKQEIRFNNFSSADVDKIITTQYCNLDEKLFNILNSNSKKALVDFLINTLSDYGHREKVQIGGM